MQTVLGKACITLGFCLGMMLNINPLKTFLSTKMTKLKLADFLILTQGLPIFQITSLML